MEAFAYITILIVFFALLAAGGLAWGEDSRPGMTDDWAR